MERNGCQKGVEMRRKQDGVRVNSGTLDRPQLRRWRRNKYTIAGDRANITWHI